MQHLKVHAKLCRVNELHPVLNCLDDCMQGRIPFRSRIMFCMDILLDPKNKPAEEFSFFSKTKMDGGGQKSRIGQIYSLCARSTRAPEIFHPQNCTQGDIDNLHVFPTNAIIDS